MLDAARQGAISVGCEGTTSMPTEKAKHPSAVSWEWLVDGMLEKREKEIERG
jgi:hypothetical protein